MVPLREPTGVAEGVEEERASAVGVAPGGDHGGEVGDHALGAAAEVEPQELAEWHDEPHRPDPAIPVQVRVPPQVPLPRAQPPQQHHQRERRVVLRLRGRRIPPDEVLVGSNTKPINKKRLLNPNSSSGKERFGAAILAAFRGLSHCII